MTYPIGPDHNHAGGPLDPPDGIDPTGVPGDRSGSEAFVVLLGILIGVLALIVTLGWVVFHHLLTG